MLCRRLKRSLRLSRFFIGHRRGVEQSRIELQPIATEQIRERPIRLTCTCYRVPKLPQGCPAALTQMVSARSGGACNGRLICASATQNHTRNILKGSYTFAGFLFVKPILVLHAVGFVNGVWFFEFHFFDNPICLVVTRTDVRCQPLLFFHSVRM